MNKTIGIVVAVVILLALAYVGMMQGWFSSTADYGADIACPLDAKVCPDGSSVGRTAPSCEFAACPGEAADTLY